MNPNSASIRSNLGLARQQAGYIDGALREYEEALRLDPSMVSAAVSVAELYDETERQAEALALRETLLLQISTLSPQYQEQYRDYEIDLKRSLARAYTSEGLTQKSVALLVAGALKDPRLLLLAALSHIPFVPSSEHEIAEARIATVAAVREVIDGFASGRTKPLLPGATVELYGDTGYFLTYHGENNERLRADIGRMHALAYPHLRYAAPHVGRPPLEGDIPGTAFDYLRASAALIRSPPHLPRKYVDLAVFPALECSFNDAILAPMPYAVMVSMHAQDSCRHCVSTLPPAFSFKDDAALARFPSALTV